MLHVTGAAHPVMYWWQGSWQHKKKEEEKVMEHSF